jgi:hypothetical protein
VDATIECLPGCSGPDRPARYPPFVFRDFQAQRVKLHTAGKGAEVADASATFDPRSAKAAGPAA